MELPEYKAHYDPNPRRDFEAQVIFLPLKMKGDSMDEFTEFQKLMIQLDVKLITNPLDSKERRLHRVQCAENAMRQKMWSPIRFYDDIYYLSDGGYSRIRFDHDSHTLGLTQNSLSNAKENWKKTAKLRKQIEAVIRREGEEARGGMQ
jgi:hypothetical protein